MTYAKLDSNNVVQQVIVAEKSFIDTQEGKWVECSDGAIGDTYHEDINKFISPKPFASWTLDGNYEWQPPVAMPDDGNLYKWHEDSQTWVKV